MKVKGHLSENKIIFQNMLSEQKKATLGPELMAPLNLCIELGIEYLKSGAFDSKYNKVLKKNIVLLHNKMAKMDYYSAVNQFVKETQNDFKGLEKEILKHVGTRLGNMAKSASGSKTKIKIKKRRMREGSILRFEKEMAILFEETQLNEGAPLVALGGGLTALELTAVTAGFAAVAYAIVRSANPNDPVVRWLDELASDCAQAQQQMVTGMMQATAATLAATTGLIMPTIQDVSADDLGDHRAVDLAAALAATTAGTAGATQTADKGPDGPKIDWRELLKGLKRDAKDTFFRCFFGSTRAIGAVSNYFVGTVGATAIERYTGSSPLGRKVSHELTKKIPKVDFGYKKWLDSNTGKIWNTKLRGGVARSSWRMYLCQVLFWMPINLTIDATISLARRFFNKSIGEFTVTLGGKPGQWTKWGTMLSMKWPATGVAGFIGIAWDTFTHGKGLETAIEFNNFINSLWPSSQEIWKVDVKASWEEIKGNTKKYIGGPSLVLWSQTILPFMEKKIAEGMTVAKAAEASLNEFLDKEWTKLEKQHQNNQTKMNQGIEATVKSANELLDGLAKVPLLSEQLDIPQLKAAIRKKAEELKSRVRKTALPKAKPKIKVTGGTPEKRGADWR